jgi:hypothetical protein
MFNPISNIIIILPIHNIFSRLLTQDLSLKPPPSCFYDDICWILEANISWNLRSYEYHLQLNWIFTGCWDLMNVFQDSSIVCFTFILSIGHQSHIIIQNPNIKRIKVLSVPSTSVPIFITEYSLSSTYEFPCIFKLYRNQKLFQDC